MFKLIKILNTGVNVPEIERFPCDPTVTLDAGTCLLYDSSCGMVGPGNESEPPTHILAKAINKGDTFALCYRVSPDMIFEAPLIGDPSSLFAGMSVELVVQSGRGICAVNDVEGGPAMIYSLENAKASGDKVLVTFSY